MHTFFITPGEFNGVGLEVTLKSIKSIHNSPNRFIIWTEKKYYEKHYPEIKQSFFESIDEIPELKGIYFLNSSLSPVQWFKASVDLCMKNPKNFGIITGPLEKKSFNHIESLGHTEYLRSLYPDKKIFMTFFGDLYNCLLLTDHCSLKNIFNKINEKLLNDALVASDYLKDKLKFLKPTLLLGLNPHAGEGGLLGDEEVKIHKKLTKENPSLIGPISPDGLFGRDSYSKYSLIIANYHDQGLIPFKALNGFNAAQASIGLPFIRTSVDHGTGVDIFNKDLANPESMIKAIKLAEELI